MTWIALTLAAYFGLALVALIDKYFLTGPVKNAPLYAAMAGLLGIVPFAFLPFDWFVPSFGQLVFDAIAGAVFILALWVYFAALKKGEATRVVPIASAFVPLSTLILATLFMGEELHARQIIGFLILVIGGVLISVTQNIKRKTLKADLHIFGLSVAASFLFATHFALIKQIYSGQPFIGGLVWSGAGKVLAGAAIFAYLLYKGKVTKPKRNKALAHHFGLYFSGRVIGGLSGLAQNYAIALASVSLVTAMQGFQYAFLFLLVLWIGKYVSKLKEKFSKEVAFQKIVAVLVLTLGLVFVVLPPPPEAQKTYVKDVVEPEYGVNFSHTFAEWIGLDWRKAYDAIITEMEVDWVRLPAYWSVVQPSPNEWNLDAVEYQVQQAAKNDVKVILAIGRKLPRWPECHIPPWAQGLDYEDQNNALMNYLRNMVEAYDSLPVVAAWQVENEPLFPFGVCPEPNKDVLQKEIDLVRSLSSKPVIVTDSGEVSTWMPEAAMGDILGTTMYREVAHETFGALHYPLPPSFFKAKSFYAKARSGKPDLQIINVELQAEPWTPRPFIESPLDEQLDRMDSNQLIDNAVYAKKTGISPILFWGAEWWYWLKEVHHQPSLWNTAKQIINQ